MKKLKETPTQSVTKAELEKAILSYLPYKVNYAFCCIRDVLNDFKKELEVTDSSGITNVLTGTEYFLCLKAFDLLLEDPKFEEFVNEELICAAWKFAHDPLAGVVYIDVLGGVNVLLFIDGVIAPECPFLFYDFMMKNHYDVFGLIRQRKAISEWKLM